MIGVLKDLDIYGHEQVIFCQEKKSGMQAIIGIHSTVLGPALGGCRMRKYENEGEALKDALRLSKGMTYKASLAGLNLGGGKAVLLGDPYTEKTEAKLRAFARYVEALGGRYITAADMGMYVPDIDIMRQETRYAVCGSNKGGSGDPSVLTSFGVSQGMKAAVKTAGLGESLEGLRIAVQGLGNAGWLLIGHLSAAGAHLIVTDTNREKVQKAVEEFGAVAAAPEDIYGIECEVFAPCAIGGTLNAKTIAQLKCKVVAGCANTQLESEEDGYEMWRKGIVYAPDYAINAGGLIGAANEFEGLDKEVILGRTSQIYTTISNILALSATDHIPPHLAADRLAEKRINEHQQAPVNKRAKAKA